LQRWLNSSVWWKEVEMKRICFALLITFIFTTAVHAQIEWKLVKNNEKEKALKNALEYLEDSVKEIAWIEIEDNDVYIGFKTLPAISNL
jgi:flavin-binding protein dodecin